MGAKTLTLYVVGLRLTDGMVQPLAWTKGRLSKKQLRRVGRNFRRAVDVVEPVSMHWARLYRSPSEAMKELPHYDAH